MCHLLQNNDQLAFLFHCYSLTCGVEVEKDVVHFLSDNVTKIDLEAVNRRTRTKCQLHKNVKIFENNISPGAERMRQVKVKGRQQKRICHMFIYQQKKK